MASIINNLSSLPEQITHERTYHWVVFRCYFYPDKIKKVPFHPLGYKADISNPNTWSNFASCIKAIDYGIGHLPGFAITSDYKLACIDMDHCIDPTGTLSQTAQKYISKFKDKAYIEKSISGKGVHILFWYTDKKQPMHPEPGVELFTDGKFVAITGDVIG